VHAIGGATGTLNATVRRLRGSGSFDLAHQPGRLAGTARDHPQQLLTQRYGVAVTALWCGVATFALLRLVGVVSPLRASPEDETDDLDISLQGEALQ
jgi:Amt family ammonium transporter